ncbi:hypothetical protein PROFUN_00281 [Planoprotostelium fungivorum]|uniref:Phosphatidylinositol transfer protein N-terminal domain-containing protein n=1 Tax=Planoprotostelium fungivorum TaxID=1890364 RepID=A0A2P6NXX7_9EUKA|nr:hypothetical protein PROFUN_00281 [Planoprotostelium fungivorum]
MSILASPSPSPYRQPTYERPLTVVTVVHHVFPSLSPDDVPSQDQTIIEQIDQAFDRMFDILREWEEINNASLDLGTSLVDNLVRTQYISLKQNWGIFGDDRELQQRVRVKLQAETQSFYDDFSTEFKKMKGLHEEMKELLKVLIDGENILKNSPPVAITATVSISDYVSYCEEIIRMYEREIGVKEKILGDIMTRQFSPDLNGLSTAGQSEENRNLLLVYLSAWQFQAYVDKPRIDGRSEPSDSIVNQNSTNFTTRNPDNFGQSRRTRSKDMVLIKEYIIPMPLTVEEYRTAQLYMVAKFSRERTTKGEGITIIKNEPFEENGVKGQFTHKQIHVGSSLPSWAKSLIPANCCVEEKAWNSYPYVRNVYSCPLFGDRFSITSETYYYDDEGEKQDLFKLTPEEKSVLEKDTIDIVNERPDDAHYKEEEDPKLFVSEKTGRGKFEEDWLKTVKPRMTIYKMTKAEFKVWGFQTKVEAYLQKTMVRDIILLGHRQAFCWMDEWFGMSMEDLRAYEQETKIYLDKIMNGEITPDGKPIVKTDSPKPAKKGWGWGSLTGTPSQSPKANSPKVKKGKDSPQIERAEE